MAKSINVVQLDHDTILSIRLSYGDAFVFIKFSANAYGNSGIYKPAHLVGSYADLPGWKNDVLHFPILTPTPNGYAPDADHVGYFCNSVE